MKHTLTSSYVRLATVFGVAVPLAVAFGLVHGG